MCHDLICEYCNFISELFAPEVQAVLQTSKETTPVPLWKKYSSVKLLQHITFSENVVSVLTHLTLNINRYMYNS